MIVRGGHWVTGDGQVTTHCTITAGPGEPQTSVTWRSGEWGCDIAVSFTPWPNQHMRTADRSESKRLA